VGDRVSADVAVTVAPSYAACSVGLVIDDSCEEVVDGVPHRRVTRGSIRHIALLGSSDDGPV
jgi:hypothetical protein